MPAYVVRKVADALNDRGQAVKGSKVLLLGMAYKKDVDDPRESPGLRADGPAPGEGGGGRVQRPPHPQPAADEEVPPPEAGEPAALGRVPRLEGLRPDRHRPFGLRLALDRRALPAGRRHQERHPRGGGRPRDGSSGPDGRANRAGSSAFFTNDRIIGHNVSEAPAPRGGGAVGPWRLRLDAFRGPTVDEPSSTDRGRPPTPRSGPPRSSGSPLRIAPRTKDRFASRLDRSRSGRRPHRVRSAPVDGRVAAAIPDPPPGGDVRPVVVPDQTPLKNFGEYAMWTIDWRSCDR